MSDTLATDLYTALLAAQRAMGPVKKDASNPAFRSKYATLQSVIETIEEPLHANGLLLVQRLRYDRIGREGSTGEGTPILITELIHAASGVKLDSHVPIVCKDPLDPQKVGGALTYFRRYSLLALLNLAPEEDDGHAAAQPPTNHPANQSAPLRRTPSPPSAPRPAVVPPEGGGLPPHLAAVHEAMQTQADRQTPEGAIAWLMAAQTRADADDARKRCKDLAIDPREFGPIYNDVTKRFRETA